MTSYGATSVLPLTPIMAWTPVAIEGYTPAPGEELQIDLRVADAGYFQTMQVPLLKGRYFNAQDTPVSQPVAIVDEGMAQRFWPDGNAIGGKVTRPNGRDRGRYAARGNRNCRGTSVRGGTHARNVEPAVQHPRYGCADVLVDRGVSGRGCAGGELSAGSAGNTRRSYRRVAGRLESGRSLARIEISFTESAETR